MDALLGSATAGLVSRLCTHPIDTAKARLQANYQQTPTSAAMKRLPYRGTFDVLVRTFQTEGIRGLYRGFGAILVGGTPGTMLYLCSYEMIKNRLTEAWQARTNSPVEGNASEFFIHFSSGMLAETIACIIYVPVDVVKERLQVQHATADRMDGQYRGSWDAAKQIARSEGLSGIYRGYAATLASFGPFSALYFVFYERFKSWTRQNLSKNEGPSQGSSLQDIEIPFGQLVLCSCSAGALASWLTSPLDMAKLRLQVQRGSLANKDAASEVQVKYRGVADCLQHAHREGGFRGLFRGAGARVLFFAPATTITMTCYEKCRSLIGRLLSHEKHNEA